ncbi:hypothetical protein [Streptomyces sp. NPDC051567]
MRLVMIVMAAQVISDSEWAFITLMSRRPACPRHQTEALPDTLAAA